MKNKAKIKVIKKGNKAVAPKPPPVAEKSKEKTDREMSSTVSDWVREFQARQQDQTKRMLKKNFTQKPETI